MPLAGRLNVFIRIIADKERDINTFTYIQMSCPPLLMRSNGSHYIPSQPFHFRYLTLTAAAALAAITPPSPVPPHTIYSTWQLPPSPTMIFQAAELHGRRKHIQSYMYTLCPLHTIYWVYISIYLSLITRHILLCVRMRLRKSALLCACVCVSTCIFSAIIFSRARLFLKRVNSPETFHVRVVMAAVMVVPGQQAASSGSESGCCGGDGSVCSVHTLVSFVICRCYRRTRVKDAGRPFPLQKQKYYEVSYRDTFFPF